MNRLLYAILTLFIAINEAAAAPKIVRLPKSYNQPLMSSTGFVTGGDSGELPFLYTPGSGVTRIGSFPYIPMMINANGDVIGFAQNSDSGTTYNYAFLTLRGQESVLLSTVVNEDYSDYFGVGMNDSGVAVVASGSKVSFFQNGTLVSEVSTPDFTLFKPYETIFVSPEGDAIMPTTYLGNYRQARITSTGIISEISEEVLPTIFESMWTNSEGAMHLWKNEKLYSVDLQSKPKKIEAPTQSSRNKFNILRRNTSNAYLARSSFNSFKPLKSYEDDFVLNQRGESTELTCLYPNRAKLYPSQAYDLSDTGSLLVLVPENKNGSRYGVLEVEPGKRLADSYCAKLEAKLLTCQSYFDSSLTQTKAAPSNTTCKMEVTVRTPSGKPLAGEEVGTYSTAADNTVVRGKTDAKGKLVFSFKLSGKDYSMQVIAPFSNPVYQGRVAIVTFYSDYYDYGV